MTREKTGKKDPVVPAQMRVRTFPVVPPRALHLRGDFPSRVIVSDTALAPDGRAISGSYLGAGPDMEQIVGRFPGPAALEEFTPPGDGALRSLDGFLDRVIWRPVHDSRFGFVTWDAVTFFSSIAFTFKDRGLWAILWTYTGEDGERLVDFHRSPIVFEPRAGARVEVRFGPRKGYNKRDLDASGRQFTGHFLSLRDAVSALYGDRVEDLGDACRLCDIEPPPEPATPENLGRRVGALRELYRAVRPEAESWPGVSVGRLPSATAIVNGVYLTARIPQPLLRDRATMRVPARCIGAGIEAASIGARTGIFLRRVDVPGLDLDVVSDYADCAALADTRDFLTHSVTAHHVSGRRQLDRMRRLVRDAVKAGLLEHPELWRSLAFLCKVVPRGDVLTAHIELFGAEATVTAPIVDGSAPYWMTGFDLALALVEDLDAGGEGRVPEIAETWTFEFGPRLRGLHTVGFPGGWVWDPRRDATYRSRDGRTWGNLYLLLAAMRLEAATDPGLTPAARIRRRGMLKTAANAGAFGMYSATVPTGDPSGPHRVITSEGVVRAPQGEPELPGPWAFPPAAALVESAGRLLVTLVMHEVRVRGGSLVQVDTDGVFVVATPDGGEIEVGA
jgi:hypothetical protein